MNTMLTPSKRSRTASVLMHSLALILVMLAPVLGLLAAAVAAWHAIVAGSIWYLPLALVIVLAAIAMIQSHKPFDLALLGLVVVAAFSWFMADSLQQVRLFDSILSLVPRTYLLGTILLVMVVALVLIHTVRRTGRW
jgi:hypothetical protein